MSKKKKKMASNYKKNIEQFRKLYNKDVGDRKWYHAFQKDSIQNSSGAVLNGDFSNLRININVVSNEKGLFLVVEDSGTVGLTGPNLNQDDLNRLSNDENDLPSNYRLARFSSEHNSGDNIGAGLYGVGKKVYAMASKSYTYYFDSFSEDGYRANMNEAGYLFDTAYEEDEAVDYIRKVTGLDPLTEHGTRIIIVDPDDELVNLIRNGTMARFVQETWWPLIEKIDKNGFIKVYGNVVEYPEDLIDNEIMLRTKENTQPRVIESGYKIKKIGLFELDPKSKFQEGFYYFRKHMQIGMIKIDDVPKSFKNKFYGYIQVDKDWEDMLSKIEDVTHYDVESKNKIEYQLMKKTVNLFFDATMEAWGHKKNEKSISSAMVRELEENKRILEKLFNDRGYDDLGKGDRKSKFSVKWKRIKYPIVDSKSIYEQQSLSVDFNVKNEYSVKNKVQLLAYIETYEKNEVKVWDIEEAFKPYEETQFTKTFAIDDSNATPYERNILVIKLKPTVGGVVEKRLPFYYRVETPPVSKQDFYLTMHNRIMPRKNSMRVNSGESITGIEYRIENNTQYEVSLRLKVSMHNAENNNYLISDVDQVDFQIGPNQEQVQTINDIHFNPTIIEEHLPSGIVEVRARIILLQQLETIEKSTILASYKTKVYFNRNEKKGIQDVFEPRMIDADEDSRRSWISGKESRRFIDLNSLHPAFKLAETKEYRQDYVLEQMLYQFVLLYLGEGNYSVLEDIDEESLSKMSAQEIYSTITSTVEGLLKQLLEVKYGNN